MTNRSKDELHFRTIAGKSRRALKKGTHRQGCKEIVEMLRDLFTDCAEEESLYPGGGYKVLENEFKELGEDNDERPQPRGKDIDMERRCFMMGGFATLAYLLLPQMRDLKRCKVLAGKVIRLRPGDMYQVEYMTRCLVIDNSHGIHALSSFPHAVATNCVFIRGGMGIQVRKASYE